MPEWMVVVLCVVMALLLPFLVLFLRRRWLTGQGGAFDCTRRSPDGPCVLGFARYHHDTLEWFPAVALGLSPSLRLTRTGTAYSSQRPAEGKCDLGGIFSNPRDVVVTERATGTEHIFTMEAESMMALMSWLESSPPGQGHLPRYRAEA